MYRNAAVLRLTTIAVSGALALSLLTACTGHHSSSSASPASSAKSAGAAKSATSSAGSSGSAVASADTVTLLVGGLNDLTLLPAELAEQLGYFKAAGITVRLVDTSADADNDSAVLAGKAQGVIGFYDNTIAAQATGKCLESVVQLANVPGAAVVVAKRDATTISNLAQLKGKKVGVIAKASTTDYLAKELAVRAGLKADDITVVAVGDSADFTKALSSGAIDAGVATDPTVATVVKSGEAIKIADLRADLQTKKLLGGLYPGSSLYVSCDWANSNKVIVQKLADALVKTLRFINGNGGANIASKLPASYADGDKALYAQAINDTKGGFTANGVIDASGTKNVLRIMQATSAPVQALKKPIELSKTYTTAFAVAVPKK